MRSIMVILISVTLLTGCAKAQETPAAATTPATATTASAEQSGALRGKIIGRDAATNQLNIDHQNVPGIMEAMTMPYEVRGAKVADLPADGSQITATLHTQDGKYWLTDVKAAQ